jgi:serine protease Do
VTNNHVISDADAITVRTNEGEVYTAVLVGTDAPSDIAVLWIDTGEEDIAAAQLGCSKDLIVGESVFAIGNPLGSLGGTVTNGIISATARSITINGEDMTLLQTNAAVNPGNSGGGLFNMAGQLIGVVNAKCSEDDVEGLGFAIPIDTAYEVICELIEYGYVRGVADAGLTLYDVTNTMTAWKNFGSTRLGAYIVDSQYTEELQFGDYLVSVEGVTILQGADLETVLASCAVGDTVTIEVIRMRQTTKNGKTVLVEMPLSINLTLKEYVPADIDVRFDTE